MRAIGSLWHRLVTAETEFRLARIAERPVAAAVLEPEQRVLGLQDGCCHWPLGNPGEAESVSAVTRRCHSDPIARITCGSGGSKRPSLAEQVVEFGQ